MSWGTTWEGACQDAFTVDLVWRSVAIGSSIESCVASSAAEQSARRKADAVLRLFQPLTLSHVKLLRKRRYSRIARVRSRTPSMEH